MWIDSDSPHDCRVRSGGAKYTLTKLWPTATQALNTPPSKLTAPPTLEPTTTKLLPFSATPPHRLKTKIQVRALLQLKLTRGKRCRERRGGSRRISPSCRSYCKSPKP